MSWHPDAGSAASARGNFADRRWIVTCLDENQILSFLQGTLPSEAKKKAEAHLATCSACTELATWAAAHLMSASPGGGREERSFVGHLAPGSRVGRYQILGAVGRGGMGEVYAAYHPDLDRRIALKVVYESGAGMVERRTRLLREARAIARLTHQNVIGVYDAGTFGDHVFLAMEYVDGQTVEEWLRGGDRGWRQVLDVFMAAGRGLAAAHAAEVVHRDFKPHNVMIGKDGSVRVMDFGLARLVEEVAPESEAADGARRQGSRESAALGSVTRTGALIGTPAYMAPEQFRGEVPDARADQFSFCVALYEALFGTRPALAHLAEVRGAGGQPDAGDEAKTTGRKASVPAWLRGILRRGLAAAKEERYPSMDALLSALARGRARLRRRISAVSATLAVLLVSLGAWQLARGNRVACEPPKDRLAAAWSGDTQDPRRAAVQRALFTAGGRQAAEIWQRVALTLDAYVRDWRAMYRDTCEATHVRGDQSPAVLDLRMRCLYENLDELRALADGLVAADATAVSRAAGAAKTIAPVARCADVPLLQAAVPLPRDPRTLADVQELRSALRDADVARELGQFPKVLDLTSKIETRVETAKYRPLRAEWLWLRGNALASQWNPKAEALLEDAWLTAISAGDHFTAAKAASSLTPLAGQLLNRPAEAERWAKVGNASLDSLPQSAATIRVRGWVAHDLSTVRLSQGRNGEAIELVKKAISLKEASLGPDHPDVAISVNNLSLVRTELRDYVGALEASDRFYALTLRQGADPAVLARWFNNRGELLVALGRFAEAQTAFERSLPTLEEELGADNVAIAHPLTGIGEALLRRGKPAAAIPPLQRALAIRESSERDPALNGRTRFLLAQALWDAGATRGRARSLAFAAAAQFTSAGRVREAAEVRAWLAKRGARLASRGARASTP